MIVSFSTLKRLPRWLTFHTATKAMIRHVSEMEDCLSRGRFSDAGKHYAEVMRILSKNKVFYAFFLKGYIFDFLALNEGRKFPWWTSLVINLSTKFRPPKIIQEKAEFKKLLVTSEVHMQGPLGQIEGMPRCQEKAFHAILNESATNHITETRFESGISFYNKQKARKIFSEANSFVPTAAILFFPRSFETVDEIANHLADKSIILTSGMKPLFGDYNALQCAAISLIQLGVKRLYIEGFDLQITVPRKAGYVPSSSGEAAHQTIAEFKKIFIESAVQHNPICQFNTLIILQRIGFLVVGPKLSETLNNGLEFYLKCLDKNYGELSGRTDK